MWMIIKTERREQSTIQPIMESEPDNAPKLNRFETVMPAITGQQIARGKNHNVDSNVQGPDIPDFESVIHQNPGLLSSIVMPSFNRRYHGANINVNVNPT